MQNQKSLSHFELTGKIIKCCRHLLPEHQAQLINYLRVSDTPIGLLVNFGNRKIEHKRMEHPDEFIEAEPDYEEIAFSMRHMQDDKETIKN
ncbi:MAG: GxxExxY protein [Nitrosotalea sp.]